MIYETFGILKAKYGPDFESILIEDVRIGPYESIVKLSGNLYGISSTYTNESNFWKRDMRGKVPFSPGFIRGQKITDLFDFEEETQITRILKIGVLNALSSPYILNSGYKCIENTDPFDLIDLSGTQTITVVGAFKSYIEKFSQTNHQLYVLELNKNALDSAFQKFFIPPDLAYSVLPASDTIIITGSALVNGTLDELLSFINQTSQVIITGPSCSFIPDVLFRNKIRIVGATILQKPEEALQLMSEAAMGYHLFRGYAKKICILNERAS
jgi:uncharacterized protein